MKFNLKLLLIIFLIFLHLASEKDNFFDEAKKMFENKKYDESNFYFKEI